MDAESFVRAIKDLLGSYGGSLPVPLGWLIVAGLLALWLYYFIPAVIRAWRCK